MTLEKLLSKGKSIAGRSEVQFIVWFMTYTPSSPLYVEPCD